MNQFQETAAKVEPPAGGEDGRISRMLEFPRRVVFLLLAYGLFAWLFGLYRLFLASSLGKPDLDWSYSLVMRQPVADILKLRLPNTLTLLGVGLGGALLLGWLLMLAAYFVHQLGQKPGPLGEVLGWIGRLAGFALLALPVILLGLGCLRLFGVQLRLLPLVGMYSPGGDANLADRLKHLVLPVLSLALIPALVSARVAGAAMAASRPGWRAWLTGFLQVPASVFRQSSGFLSALVLVEMVFAWPGIGRVAVTAFLQGDMPLLLACIQPLVLIVLAGRILSELFAWQAYAHQPRLEPDEVEKPTPRALAARRTWLIFTLVALLIPLGLAAYGAGVSHAQASQMHPGSVLQAPSAQFPLGTDRLGRDLLARIRLGTAGALGAALGTAVLAGIPAFLFGLLAGWLQRMRKLWADFLADLLLLPTDLLLLLPVLALALLVRSLSPQPLGSWLALSLLAAGLVQPRLVRVMALLWKGDGEGSLGRKLLLCAGVLLASGLFAGLSASVAVDFLNLGLSASLASPGLILQDAMLVLTRTGAPLMAGVFVWAALWAFFLVLDGLLGDFQGKHILDWLFS